MCCSSTGRPQQTCRASVVRCFAGMLVALLVLYIINSTKQPKTVKPPKRSMKNVGLTSGIVFLVEWIPPLSKVLLLFLSLHTFQRADSKLERSFEYKQLSHIVTYCLGCKNGALATVTTQHAHFPNGRLRLSSFKRMLFEPTLSGSAFGVCVCSAFIFEVRDGISFCALLLFISVVFWDLSLISVPDMVNTQDCL